MAIEPDDKNNDLFIIGCGFPRTGTGSMREALNTLGFKCYHMKQVFIEGYEHQLKWINVEKQKLELKKSKNITVYKQWNEIQVDYDWNEIFQSSKDGTPYTATVDGPSCSFYAEIMKFYPNHKVILTVRDDAEIWYGSAMNSIYYGSRYYLGYLYFYLFNKTSYTHHRLAIHFWDLLFDDKFEDKQRTMKRYNEWNQSAIDYVAKDKLLIFNAKHDGWEKLCKFLDIKEIPQGPFPHVNEGKIFAASAKITKRKAIGFNVALGVTFASFVAYSVYKIYSYNKNKNN